MLPLKLLLKLVMELIISKEPCIDRLRLFLFILLRRLALLPLEDVPLVSEDLAVAIELAIDADELVDLTEE